MPKDIDSGILKYFFMSGVTVLTGYEFELASGTEKYVANTDDVGGYTALTIKRNPVRSEEGTILTLTLGCRIVVIRPSPFSL